MVVLQECAHRVYPRRCTKCVEADKKARGTGSSHGNYVPLAERFWAKVDVRGVDECWPWLGGVNDRGYGRILVDRVSTGAHVVSFFLEHGRWPAEGMQVHHTCFNRPCQNPAHHEEVTPDYNKRTRKSRAIK